jgi:hypothetical protein
VLELPLTLTSEQALAECRRRGLVVAGERELARRPGSRHWHLRIPDRAGTLELTECEGAVWVKVHPLREGDWAAQLARELAELPGAAGKHLTVVVDRPDVPVMLVRAADDQPSITQAWAELERAIGSLRGRKFYGVFDHVGREYRACVELQDGDDPDALGLERGTLPGGRYAQERLRGDPPAVYALIAPAFHQLAQRPDCDRQRPSLEFYRRHNVIDLLQPVG